MRTIPTRAYRRRSQLMELAKMELSVARVLHARAREARTPQAAADLARAFDQVGRSLRRTIALEAELERERAREAPNSAAEEPGESEPSPLAPRTRPRWDA